FLDPDKISDIYILIECSDYGKPSLTTLQTIHFELIHRDIHQHNELTLTYIKLLRNFIMNDVNCACFNQPLHQYHKSSC
ncbi:hypothetical protein EWB00_005882, partial [Schistosoma japonicum]